MGPPDGTPRTQGGRAARRGVLGRPRRRARGRAGERRQAGARRRHALPDDRPLDRRATRSTRTGGRSTGSRSPSRPTRSRSARRCSATCSRWSSPSRARTSPCSTWRWSPGSCWRAGRSTGWASAGRTPAAAAGAAGAARAGGRRRDEPDARRPAAGVRVCRAWNACCGAWSGGRRAGTSAAGLIGAAGVLIKFPALALVPVFLVVAVRRRRWGPLLAAAGPVAALVAWQAASRSLYGASQVQAGLSFLGQFRTAFARQVAERTLTMFAILAWTFPVWVLAPSRLGRRGRLVAGLAARARDGGRGRPAGSASAWRRPWVGRGVPGRRGARGVRRSRPACSPAAAAGEADARADDPRPLLWAWIVGVAAIVIPFGPFVAVRSFLPIQPPLVLLLLSRRARGAGRRLAAAVGLTAVLGAALAAADFRWAACYPAAARRLAAEYGDGRPAGPVPRPLGLAVLCRARRVPALGRPLARRADRRDRDRPVAGRPAVDAPRRRPPAPAPRADHDPARPARADDLEPRRGLAVLRRRLRRAPLGILARAGRGVLRLRGRSRRRSAAFPLGLGAGRGKMGVACRGGPGLLAAIRTDDVPSRSGIPAWSMASE